MKDCLFCSIAAGTVPSNRVIENDSAVVFADIHPQAPVHLLVVPKRHVETVRELSGNPELAAALFAAAERAAEAAGVAASGYRLIVNQGPDAGQIVPHLHIHLLGGKPLGAKIVS